MGNIKKIDRNMTGFTATGVGPRVVFSPANLLVILISLILVLALILIS